jgi:argininosuccinate lyase
MRQATERGMLGATDLADHLAARGVPFRDAHEAVGRIVRDRLAKGLDLVGLTDAELRGYDPRVSDGAADGATIASSLAARRSPGGTAPERVREALAEANAAFEL